MSLHASLRHAVRKALLFLSAISGLALMGATSANDTVRPGLWEITTTSDLLKLTGITPEGMQNLKDLADQYGVDISQLPTGESASQVCITPEMAGAKKPPDFHDAETGCTTRNATRNGNKYRYDFVCSSSKVKGKGSAEGTFTTPQRFSGRTQFSGVAQGVPVDEKADISGRWVGSNCGAVKPPL